MRNPVVAPLLAFVAACVLGIALCIMVMVSGCAVNETVAAIDALEARSPEARLAAIEALGSQRDPRGVPVLVSQFTWDAETREENAKALVYRGRDEVKRNPKGTKNGARNQVMALMADVVKRDALPDSVKAKGVWVMAEVNIKNVVERDAIKAAIGGTAVAAEVAISLDKLGWTDKGHEFELLADGHTYSSKYDPQERGHIEEVD